MTGDSQWFAAAVDNAVLLSALRRLVHATNDTELADATSAAARLLDKPHPGAGLLDTLQASAEIAERATKAAEELRAQNDALTTENGLLRETITAVPDDEVQAANELLHCRREIVGLNDHISNIFKARAEDRTAAQARLAELETELKVKDACKRDAEAAMVMALRQVNELQAELDGAKAYTKRLTDDFSRERRGYENSVRHWADRARELESELKLWNGRFVECDAINKRLVEERWAVEAERDREQTEARRLSALADELDERLEEEKLARQLRQSELERIRVVLRNAGQDVYDAERGGLVRAVRELSDRAVSGRATPAPDPLDDARREASGFNVPTVQLAPKVQPGRDMTQLARDLLSFHAAIAPNVTIQDLIWQSVVDRGYAAGYTPEQLVARQMVKLVEEVAEAASHVTLDEQRPRGVTFDTEMWAIGERARVRFDEKNWIDCGPDYDAAQVIPELYDCQVVLCALASVIGELTGQPVDLLRGALEKSRGDVARGVRGSQEGAS